MQYPSDGVEVTLNENRKQIEQDPIGHASRKETKHLHNNHAVRFGHWKLKHALVGVRKSLRLVTGAMCLSRVCVCDGRKNYIISERRTRSTGLRAQTHGRCDRSPRSPPTKTKHQRRSCGPQERKDGRRAEESPPSAAQGRSGGDGCGWWRRSNVYIKIVKFI